MEIRLRKELKRSQIREVKLKRRLDRIQFAILRNRDVQIGLQNKIEEAQNAHRNKAGTDRRSTDVSK